MTLQDSYEFDCEDKERPVTLKNFGTYKHPLKCVARQLGGLERDQWVTFLAGKQKYNKQGNSAGFNDLDAIEAQLIAKGLVVLPCTKNKIEEERPFTIQEAQQLPAGHSTKIYNLIKELSGIDDKKEEAEDEAKND